MSARAAARPRVVVLQESLPQYRIELFGRVHSRLQQAEVDFVLVFGKQPDRDPNERVRTLPHWAVAIENRRIGRGRRHLVWQPALSVLRRGDVVVVEQASRHLINYVLLAGQALRLVNVVYWGHGRASLGTKVGESIKRWSSSRPRWWFAYTEGSRKVVESMGYPERRITVLDNALDTRALQKMASFCRQQLHLDRTGPRAAFVGTLYAEKGLDYLFATVEEIRAALPDFELVVIGDGPERERVVDVAARTDWIHYAGPAFGQDLVEQLVRSDVLLVPGAVGLVVLDAFATECPLITVDGDGHGPEIEYLLDGVNGRCLDRGSAPSAYAAAAVDVLGDPDHLRRLQAGCRAAAERYTLENMVDRFVAGCLAVCGVPPLRTVRGA